MGIDHSQLREYVIRPTLHQLDWWSESAEELLMLTAAAESLGGQFLRQVGGGPARGIFQMEPATHNDIWRNYLLTSARRAPYADRIRGLVPREALESPEGAVRDITQLATNLGYAAAMCRAHYRRVPAALPPADDIRSLAAYWKAYYNTHLGAGRPEEAIEKYYAYTAGE